MLAHICVCLGLLAAGASASVYGAENRAFVGQPAPDFEAKAVLHREFVDVGLADYKGKWLILFTYPLDWTFVCPTEIIEFSDRVGEFQALNAAVVGASVDSLYSHQAWIDTAREKGGLGDMKIPLIADLTKKLSRDYGVLLEDEGFALRGLFLIDPKGVIRHITINDPPVGRNVDEVLRLLQAFQFHESHGEVCPSSWKPGQDTIVPDPKRKLEFFARQSNDKVEL